MRYTIPVLGLFLALTALGFSAPVSRAADAQEVFLEKRRDFLLHAGQRHLELGSWARKKGLVPQATTEQCS